MSVEVRVADEFKGVEAATRLSEVFLEPLGGLRLRLSFSLIGGLRDAFGPDSWELAYRGNDMMLILRYSVEVHREGVLGRRVLGPIRLQKEARLYWSRDPWIDRRVWALVVDEDERVYRPRSADEARQLLFDFERELELTPGSLPSGRSELTAKVKVWWSRHVYCERGEREGRSRPAVVEVP